MHAPLAAWPSDTAQELDVGTPRLPTPWLLYAFAGKGFVCEACVLEHDLETPRLVLDSRKTMSKNAYFRCVAAAFQSNRSTALDAYLLRHSKQPPHGKTTKQLQELVKGTNSEAQPVVHEALNESVPSAAWRRLMLHQSAELAGVLEIYRHEAAEIPRRGCSRWRRSSHGRASWRCTLRGGRRS